MQGSCAVSQPTHPLNSLTSMVKERRVAWVHALLEPEGVVIWVLHHDPIKGAGRRAGEGPGLQGGQQALHVARCGCRGCLNSNASSLQVAPSQQVALSGHRLLSLSRHRLLCLSRHRLLCPSRHRLLRPSKHRLLHLHTGCWGGTRPRHGHALWMKCNSSALPYVALYQQKHLCLAVHFVLRQIALP